MRVDYYNNIHNSLSTNKLSLVPQSNYKTVGVQRLNSDSFAFTGSDNLLRLSSKELVSKIKSTISDDSNILGKGGEASVYRIDEGKYCVRIPTFLPDDYKAGIIQPLSEYERLNHAVLKLGYSTTIMPVIEGFSLFPSKSSGVTRKMVHSMIDELPVSAYVMVIQQISSAYNKGGYFDPSGANIIINPVQKTMTIIDFTNSQGCVNSRFCKSLFSTLTLEDGIITTSQKKDRANKILSAIIQDFLPEKPLTDISISNQFNDVIYCLRNKELISNKYCDVMINTFNKLKENKFLSMEGVQGSDAKLKGSLKTLKSLINQLLT